MGTSAKVAFRGFGPKFTFTMSDEAVRRQREYYAKTADSYDAMRMGEPEHEFALAWLHGLIVHHGYTSLLDVGSGTGRVFRHALSQIPAVKIKGVEPVRELREVGYQHGISPEDLIEGDALKLPFETDSWDIVCAFGILHHIPDPEKAVLEMCRVARYAVFFSDLNNFGCGSRFQRMFAQTLHALHLWKPFQWLKNRGKFEKYSEGDGVHYSYSLFDSLKTIQTKFPQVHLCNTKGKSPNLYRGCSHVAVFSTMEPAVYEDLIS